MRPPVERKVDPSTLVNWDTVDSAALEKARSSQLPLVVLFPKDGTQKIEEVLVGREYAALKDKHAAFVVVPYKLTRGIAPAAKESLAPVCRLSGENPAAAYGIKGNEFAILVLDCYGNLKDVGTRFNKAPTAGELKDAIGKVTGRVETLNRRLQKQLDSANTVYGKNDREGAFRQTVKILEEGVYGHKPSTDAEELYRKICDEVLAEIADLKAGEAEERKKRLQVLAGVYTRKNAPAVAAEIAAAQRATTTSR